MTLTIMEVEEIQVIEEATIEEKVEDEDRTFDHSRCGWPVGDSKSTSYPRGFLWAKLKGANFSYPMHYWR